MIKLHRPDPPDWLTQNKEKWGKRYEAKVQDSAKNNQFTWPTYKKQKINHRLLPILSKMTHNHCSFCDGYPMGASLEPTIDHFRPKTLFPRLVCEWENLFLCCRLCQRKNDSFDEGLLKPDEPSFEFHQYFLFNYSTGEIEVNPIVNPQNQQRAKVTIDIFQLNKFERPEARLLVLQTYVETTSLQTDDFSYRFMFD